jgi:multicomponent Na+:H+ antiporter subunit B
VIVTLTGGALIYGTLDMPAYGDPNAPVHQYPQPNYMERAEHDMHGIPNVVTAVLASYRGYDTLGETTVIFTAAVAVTLLMRRPPLEAMSLQDTTSTKFGDMSESHGPADPQGSGGNTTVDSPRVADLGRGAS